MNIYQADKTMICTRRIGLKKIGLRVLRDAKGKKLVAVDPVGVNENDWVFTSSGSAARLAVGDFEILTDLTICGIIDYWDPDSNQ